MTSNLLKSLKFEHSIGLKEELDNKNKTYTVKLGFDPTSPDLHLGHYVVLKGAKKFQDAGHQIVIIVGDFTASIGDPSGRNKLRPPLSEEQIVENAKTYMEQVFLILDKEKTKVKRNSEWLNKLSIKDMLAILSSVTISQILAREDFKKRFEDQIPIHMHELTYPLMQGLDSVAIKADIELGGTDQLFNLMMGRELQKSKGLPEQMVATFPLLVGLDGVKKMSKSLGNHIGLLEDPTNKFGKIMSISDETMWNYWSILEEKTDDEISLMKNSGINPKNLKINLAENIVTKFHGKEIAEKVKNEFIERFSNKKIQNIEEIEVKIEGNEILLSHLIKDLNMATSVGDANRKIEQNGVKLNQEKVIDKKSKLTQGDEFLLQVGKLHIKKVKIVK